MGLLLLNLLVFALMIQPREIRSERVLFISSPFYSHMHVHMSIGTELVKLGHEVTFAAAEPVSLDKLVEGTGIAQMKFKPPPPGIQQMFGEDMDEKVFRSIGRSSPFDEIKETSACASHYCDAMLSDNDFMQRVQDMKFALIFLDAVPFIRCLAILPKKLGIPFATESPIPENLLSGAPFWTSVTPSLFSDFTEDMNYFDRLQSLKDRILQNIAEFPINAQWVIEKHLPGENLNYRQLLAKSVFWIYGTIDPVFDYPSPSMPNSLFAGGLTTSPAKPLPRELEKFFSDAEHGVVLFSMGSLVQKMPHSYLQKFFDAFARLKQKVLVKLPKTNTSELVVSENVLTQSWIPQNDVLGHRNTVLFITHCGANGVYEGLYHSVPMLGVPVMPTDQIYNAKKIQTKRIGLSMDLNTFTSDDAFDLIQKILSDPSFKENVKKASRVFKGFPETPRKRAAFWLDHVIKHGGGHLRPLAIDRPWYIATMLDVITTVLLLPGLVLWIVFLCSRRIYSLIITKSYNLLKSTKKNN